MEKPSSGLCKYCSKPLEVMKVQIPFRAGKEISITLTCECVTERQKKLEREYQRREMMQVLHSQGFQSGKYARMTFSSWRNHNVGMKVIITTALDYVHCVDFDNQNWLYLYGDNGLGKTHIAVASARQIALDRQWRPAICRWSEYCGLVQQSWNDTSIKVDWNLTRKARIFVLDDIDKKAATPWSLGRLYDILEYRYINELPTIITANRSILELSNFWNRNQETKDLSRAIISRIMGQLFKLLHFEGQDYRLCGDKQ